MARDITEEEMGNLLDNIAAAMEREEKARKLMEFLGIPQSKYTNNVSFLVLYEIFTNPQKCQELVSKLKMKAFW